jgi:hypothetical protein
MELGLGMSPFMIKAGGIILQFLLRPPSPQSAPLLFPFTTLMAQVLCPGYNKSPCPKQPCWSSPKDMGCALPYSAQYPTTIRAHLWRGIFTSVNPETLIFFQP